MRKRLIQNHRERSKKTKNSSRLDALRNLKIAYIPYNELFKEGIIAGFGWAIGVTIGFVFISGILAIILSMFGGLPLIGSWIANIVQVTQSQLLKRSPIFPK
jgi:hypothetical protein